MGFRSEFNDGSYMVEWFKLYKKSIQNMKASHCNGTLPYRSFSPRVVEFIFKLTDKFGIDNALKYNCVDLYDKFLSEHFIYMHKKVYNNRPNRWSKVLEKCQKESYLRVLCCIQLMSKYTRQSPSLTLKDIHDLLNQTGHLFTKKNIQASEFEVFRTVGYKLNEPSTFTLVEYFLTIIPVDTTEDLYSTCLVLTDLVYIYHQELHDHIQYKKTGYRNHTYCEKLEFLDIECDKITTAAVVVVTAFFITNSNEQTNEELCEYLSTVCDKPTDHLYMISSVLISILNSI